MTKNTIAKEPLLTNAHMLSPDKQLTKLTRNRDLLIKQLAKAIRNNNAIRTVKLTNRLSDTNHRLETLVYKLKENTDA